MLGAWRKHNHFIEVTEFMFTSHHVERKRVYKDRNERSIAEFNDTDLNIRTIFQLW